jgi:hypothetical protein
VAKRDYFLPSPSYWWRPELGFDPAAWTREGIGADATGSWLISLDLLAALGAARDQARDLVAAAREAANDGVGEARDFGFDPQELAAAQEFLRTLEDPGRLSNFLHHLSRDPDDGTARPEFGSPPPLPAPFGPKAPDPAPAPSAGDAGPSSEAEAEESDAPDNAETPLFLPQAWATFGWREAYDRGARYELITPRIDAETPLGQLSMATLDADLDALLATTGVKAGDHVLVGASSGDLAGSLFLVFETNGQAGYQAGVDEVFLITPGAPPPLEPDPPSSGI